MDTWKIQINPKVSVEIPSGFVREAPFKKMNIKTYLRINFDKQQTSVQNIKKTFLIVWQNIAILNILPRITNANQISAVYTKSKTTRRLLQTCYSDPIKLTAKQSIFSPALYMHRKYGYKTI